MHQILYPTPIPVHLVESGTPWWSIASIGAAFIVGFGAAFLGALMQRRATNSALTRQLQIDSAAKFIGSAADFSVAYTHAWAPGTENATPTERHRPIFEVVLTLRSRAAAVGIVGPDDLAAAAAEIVRLAADRGLGTSFVVPSSKTSR